MFEVYERLDKEHVVLQLRDGTGSVVDGFDYKVLIDNMKDVKALKKMLERERDTRNRRLRRKVGGQR